MYINIGPMSSTDTDEDETPSAILMKPNSNSTVIPNSNTLTKLKSTKEKKACITTEMKQKPEKDPSLNHEDDDSTYYNIESIITSIKVNELKEYIFKKQLKEDFEKEYKVSHNILQLYAAKFKSYTFYSNHDTVLHKLLLPFLLYKTDSC